MIINFSYTAQNKFNEVEFYNTRGQVVRTYPLADLEDYVVENELNSYRIYVGGIGASIGPDAEVENKYMDVSEYLDSFWATATELFYNHMYRSEFESKNLPQQTRTQC